jgi:hypothetical protein
MKAGLMVNCEWSMVNEGREGKDEGGGMRDEG